MRAEHTPRNPFSLDGKIGIITGAAQGLGKAMALAFAEAGAHVVCADINMEGARETARQIKDFDQESLAVRLDVTSSEEIERMVEETVLRFGKIDILVNNAGINLGGEFPPETLQRGYWDKTLDVNLTGPFLCAQATGRQMIRQRKGKIINMASMSGLVVNRLTDRHPISYCVSKAGIIMLTKVLAVEWARYNINVNAIAPTYMKTTMIHPDPKIQQEMIRDIPLNRLGQPEDLKGTAVYLASPASDFVTGHTLLIDGGYTAW